MIRMVVLALLLCAGCVPCRTARGRELATAPPRTETRKGDKLVCKREMVMGSHMPKRICRYESERRRVREATREKMRHIAPAPAVSPEVGK